VLENGWIIVLIRQNLLRLLQHFAIACLILSGQVAAETDSTSIGLSSNEQAWLREYPVMLGAKPDMSINRFQDLDTALPATSLGVTDVTGSALDAMASHAVGIKEYYGTAFR
jgi:hypothetical protein